MGYFLVQSDFYFARSLVLFKHNTGKLSQARLFSRLVWLSRQSRQAKPRSRQMGGDAKTVFGLRLTKRKIGRENYVCFKKLHFQFSYV